MAKSLALILCLLSLHYQTVVSQCVRQSPPCNRQEIIDQRLLQTTCPRQQTIAINRPEIPCPCQQCQQPIVINRPDIPCPCQQCQQPIIISRPDVPCPCQQCQQPIVINRPEIPCPCQQCQQPIVINRPDTPCPCQQCQQPIVINRPEVPCPYQQSVVINRPEMACPCPQCQPSTIIEPACNKVPVISQTPSTIIITDCTPESCKNLAETLQLMVVCDMLEKTQGGKQYALQLAEPILRELLTSPVFSCGCPNPIANNFVAPYSVAPNLIANGIAPLLTSVADFCPNKITPNIIPNPGQCQCRKGLTDILNFL